MDISFICEKAGIGTLNANRATAATITNIEYFAFMERSPFPACRFRFLNSFPPETSLSLLPQNLLDLADLSLNFAGDLFTGTFRFQLWVIAQFPGDLLYLALQFVKRAFRLVLRAGFHGVPPF
jgi:hypothetical protein